MFRDKQQPSPGGKKHSRASARPPSRPRTAGSTSARFPVCSLITGSTVISGDLEHCPILPRAGKMCPLAKQTEGR